MNAHLNAHMPAKPTMKRERGRPATGNTRTKVSVSIPDTLLTLAKKKANKNGESLSQLVARAIQILTLDQ